MLLFVCVVVPDSQSEFQISREVGIFSRRGGSDIKFETRFESQAQQHKQTNNTNNEQTTNKRTLTKMTTMTFSLTFDGIRDFIAGPLMKKVLRTREDSYLANIKWLDEDLEMKVEDRYQANIKWLDEDLEMKVEDRYQANIKWLDEDLNNKTDEAAAESEPVALNERIPKRWHCGNGVWLAALPRLLTPGAQWALTRARYEDGLANNTCSIHHSFKQEQGKGNNTRKQYQKFQKGAREGDIIFNHCSRRGGLTHYGFFTGRISGVCDLEASRTTGQGCFWSFISVDEWIPLPEVVKGTGLNCTLYEVTPTNKKGLPTKNYINYSIPA